ncbi:MAG: S26 family signal peptidase [Candidatus Izemoplasmatales bacterium]
MKKAKLFTKIKNIIFYAIVIFLGSYLVFDMIAPDLTVSVFGFKTYVIISPSMTPEINVNDAVLVRKANLDKLNAGDIITFKAYIPELKKYSYVTHYIGDVISTDDGMIFKTHGYLEEIEEEDFDVWEDKDGNTVNITEDDVLGIVAFKIPKAGHVIRIFQDPVMLLLIFVNIGVIAYVVHYYRKTKQTTDKEE